MIEQEHEGIEARLRAAAPPQEERCVAEPEFDVGRLDAWRTGRDDADVAEHLGACGHCRDLLSELRPLSPAELEQLEPRATRWWPVGAVLAAAAAVVLAVWPTAAPLPEYRAEAPTGGVALLKSAPAKTARYRADSRLAWLLRPVTRTGHPAARAFVERDGQLRAIPDAYLMRLDGGALRLELTAGDVFRGPPGPRTLRVGIASDASDLASDGDRWPGNYSGVWYAVTVQWEGEN